MSSLVIGLNINDSHITSTLIRVGPSPQRKLSIERDTYFTRSYEINPDSDPRNIISIWIECINDVIIDFINHYQPYDNIIGISIGMLGPMDYEAGVCCIQSTNFNKFFGLNIRLSLEQDLKKLVARWKRDYYDKYHPKSSTHIPRKTTILDELGLQTPRKLTITSPTTPRTPIIFDLPPPTLEHVPENKILKMNLTNFCGRYDDSYDTFDDSKTTSSICRSRRDTYFHDIEANLSTDLVQHNHFYPGLWAVIEKLVHIPISFYNDTVCFGLGEANSDYNQGYKRILALTLGSTFSSAFLDGGEVITDREDVPLEGDLSNCPYDQFSTAADWFSTRGLSKIYRKLLHHESPNETSVTSGTISSIDEQQNDDDLLNIAYNLAQKALIGDSIAIKTFKTFAHLLGHFLKPYVTAFHTQLILIKGSLTEVWYLLENELSLTVRKYSQAQVYFSLSYGKSICMGAVQQQCLAKAKNSFRRTDQYLLPVTKLIDTSQYDIYPSHQIPNDEIGVGHFNLNEKLCKLIDDDNILLIDGFVGTYFNEYAQKLNKYYSENRSSPLLFYDTRTFLQTDSNLERELYLKSPKSIFGKLASDLDFKKNFIDAEKFKHFKNNLSYPCVIIGPGSAYVDETLPVVYIDLAKNELNYRVATETSFSYLKPTKKLKSSETILTPAMYEHKCLYFLDFPVFNKMKHELLPRIKYFVDGQRPNCPTWIYGNSLRQALIHIADHPMRVRPWFQSASWGGQWLKTVCKNLSKQAKNYAWSCEMIQSDNGILLSDVNHHLLEVSWTLFYGSQYNKILGNEIHRRLFSEANDFPLRFGLLDSMDGGNLPLQCSPSLQYMREHFGEKIAQDEAYYIVETKQHWKEENSPNKTSSTYIYLGFHDNVDRTQFHQALKTSDKKKQELNIDKYVQRMPTNVHDFFLVPNQTIHACGRNQVILEISSRPHIYAFKLYDWLRVGMDGRPRVLNIEHGMKNVRFDRNGKHLRCNPKSVKIEKDKYEEHHLTTHHLHYYDVKRLIIEPNENVQLIRLTENRFHLCMLVEGDAIEVQYSSNNDNQEKYTKQYNYIETFLIPASVNQYRLRPIIKNNSSDLKHHKFVLIIAYLRWDCEKVLK